jgi:hypothetical protein
MTATTPSGSRATSTSTAARTESPEAERLRSASPAKYVKNWPAR